MATDGQTPPPCNDRVFSEGTVVFVTSGIPSNAMERWVQGIASESGQEVDWHFFAGRALVKAVGDLSSVEIALKKWMPEHDRLQAQFNNYSA